MSIIRYYSSLFNGEAFLYPDQYIGAIFMLCITVTFLSYGVALLIFRKFHIRPFLYYVLKSVLLGKFPRWSIYKSNRYMLIMRENEAMLKHDFRIHEVQERDKELLEIEEIIERINTCPMERSRL